MAKPQSQSAAPVELPPVHDTANANGYRVEVSVEDGWLWISHGNTNGAVPKTLRIPLGALNDKNLGNGKKGGHWHVDKKGAPHGWPVYTVQQ